MTTKITALTMSACAVVLSLVSWTKPNSAIAFFVSANSAIAITRLALALALVVISYKTKLRFRGLKALLMIGALLLVVFGLIGMITPTLEYSLYGLVDPLDYMFLIAIGFMMMPGILTLKAGKKRLPLPRLQLARLKVPEFGPLVRSVQTRWSL